MNLIERNISNAKLKGYLHDRLADDKPYSRPAVIILPGGAYERISRREGEPIALEFLSAGYQAFILEYSVGRGNIEKNSPEKETADTVAYIRENADEFDVNKNQIVLLGLSAGGHAVLSSQCHYSLLNLNGRADALVLCYPVVTVGEYGHSKSTFNITGGDEEKKAYYSLENQINRELPPTFIWHTTEDKTVSAMNTIFLVSSLLKNKVAFEYHLFEKGAHGLSICTNDVNSREEHASKWLSLVFAWLSKTLGYVQ